MAKYKARQSFPMPHPQNPKRQILVRGGDVVDLPDDFVDGGVESGVLQRLDEDGQPAQVAEATETELPPRPSNGATKVEWRAYLVQLNEVTREDLDDDLVIPDNATRDEMIAIGDTRVAEWNSLDED